MPHGFPVIKSGDFPTHINAVLYLFSINSVSTSDSDTLLHLPSFFQSTTDDKMDNEKIDDLKLTSLHVDDIESHPGKEQHVKVDEKLSALESIKRFPKALACCCYMLFICIMWGYDGMAGSVSCVVNPFGIVAYNSNTDCSFDSQISSRLRIPLRGRLRGLCRMADGIHFCIALWYHLRWLCHGSRGTSGWTKGLYLGCIW